MKFLLTFFLFLSGCVYLSGYKRSFRSHIPTGESNYNEWVIKYQPAFLKEGQKPKLYIVKELSQSLREWKSKHYITLGYSSFTGPYEGDWGLVYFAKKLGATVILKSKSYESSSVRGGGGFIKDGKGYINETYTIQRYDQHAYFLVKSLRKQSIGIGFDDLQEKERKMYRMNTGAIIRTVYKDTPAFFANFLRDDIIIEVENEKVQSSGHLAKILRSLKKTQIQFAILRDGERKVITIKPQTKSSSK